MHFRRRRSPSPRRRPLVAPLIEPLEIRRLLSGASLQTTALPARQVELLNRGVVAVRSATSNVFISWRLLGTDPGNVAFNVYRDGGTGAVKLNASPLSTVTDFVDSTFNASATNVYSVRPVINNIEQAASETFTLPASSPVRQYLNIPLQIPANVTVPDVANPGQTLTVTYNANDATVADVDGDGQYEIILKWDSSQSKDSSQDGFTGDTYLDCYKLDGTLMWRIDEGQNIRAGAHYTQFIAYDLDGDGKAEVALKTAPGTIDGQGNPVLLGSDHVTDDYRSATTGRINSGPEYLTIFNGQTGAQMVTVPYKPDRIATSSWGDDYGNRQDRYLMCVAYLDGQRPSLVIGRGLFPGQSSGHAVRNELTAWNWRGGQLSMLWWFRADSHASSFGLPDVNTAYVGQGNYEMHPADVDGDGRDEIVFGSMTVNDDGTPLYSTGLGHGDALHVSDMDPSHPGLEIYMPMESPGGNGHITSNVHDGATGAILFNTNTRAGDADPDVGRGNAFDIDPRYPGYEVWDSYDGTSATDRHIYNPATNTDIQSQPSNMFDNFGVWWDADPLRELEDGTTISDWKITNGVGGRSNYDLDPATSGTQTAPNAASNNGTKSTPCLSADILGDWREEVVWRRSDNTALEIFTTTIPATNRYYTLMHDVQYREAIAWQNIGYNQPPHPSFFLGAVDANGTPSTAPTPNIYTPAAGGFPPTTLQAEVNLFGGGTVAETTNANYNATGYVNFPTTGGFLEFDNVDGGAGGITTLNIRYANGSSSRTGQLIINGVPQSITFPNSTSFTNWRFVSINVPLSAGATNTIRIESTGQDVGNIDEISIDQGTKTGFISGQAFQDSNDDGTLASEPTLNGISIYLDTNNNGTQDLGELSTTTSGSGSFSFASLPDGPYKIRASVPTDFVFTGAASSTAATLTGGAGATLNLPYERIAYTGSPQANNYLLRKNTAGKYEILISNVLAYTVFANAPSLSFDLGGGDDVMTIDLVHGAPIPAVGLNIDGGADGTSAGDKIAVVGTSGAGETIAFNAGWIAINASGFAPANFERVTFDSDDGLDDVIVNAGPTVVFPDPQQIDSLALNNVATAAIAAAGGTLLTRDLAIAPGAHLDLADNALAWNYSTVSPVGTWTGSSYDQLTGLIAAGLISTSAGVGDFTKLGVAEASQALGVTGTDTALFENQTVDSTTVCVKFTYGGDANLDGKINIDDYVHIDQGIASMWTGWFNGDFNYDGKVNIDDYVIIDTNIANQTDVL